ncbi:MAG: nucleotide sugar dehydrogenase [Ignavibacteriaceae bacterium]
MSNNNICIIGGCGHVGLPLAIKFASNKLNVDIYDINKESIEKINKGIMPFKEEGMNSLLKSVAGKYLFATNDKNIIKKSKYIIIIIGTPIDEHLNPDFTLIKRLLNELIPFLKDNQYLILRSTIFPGSTKLVKNIIESSSKDIKVAFCPERIAEGKANEELESLPQIVSAFDIKTKRIIGKLFRNITNEIIYIEPLEAELAKLFTNSWRYIQFATSNQFFMISQEYGVDFYKILEAIKFKYPRAKDFPKAGFAAGPCLFKDTMQISSFYNNNFFLGHAAMLINEGLPSFIVNHLKTKFDLSKMSVGILGMAFKADSDDKRESLSYKLKKILEMEAKQVYCSDVYINDLGFISVDDLIRKSDIIIIGAPHKQYTNLKFNKKKLFDIWNFYNNGSLL